jgi:hypothetical protein
MISCSTVTQFSPTISASAVTYCFLRFHASAMTLFLLPIRCVSHEFNYAIDSIRQQSLIFHWCFLGLESLSFRWWFLGHELVFVVDSMRHPSLNFQWWFLVLEWPRFHRRLLHQQWHSVFDDSMRRPWLYFGNRCHVSVGNSLTLSIPYVSCHLVFSDDF